MMKSSRPSTESWWTPTFKLFHFKFLLYPSPTGTWLRALAYIHCISRTIHSFTPGFLQGTQSNAFSRSTKAMQSLLLSATFSCSCLTTKIASVVPLPGTSQTENGRLTPNVWWGHPQSSPGLTWPALSAWDRSSCPFTMHPSYPCGAGLGDSVGCAVQMETRRMRVQPPPRSATFFHGDWSWNIFYGHSLPSPDSRRAVVSFWRKNVHNTG